MAGPGTPFPKGKSGNPKGNAGRTEVRYKISTKFLNAFLESFEKHGEEAIERLRLEDPKSYVGIALALEPKELKVEHTQRDVREYSTSELRALLAQHLERAAGEAGGGGIAAEVRDVH